MKLQEVLQNLCYYDLRNPDCTLPEIMTIEELRENYGHYSKKNCYCDNCFYGKSKLAEYCLKLLNIKDEKFNN